MSLGAEIGYLVYFAMGGGGMAGWCMRLELFHSRYHFYRIYIASGMKETYK